jgi:hypothetical protein
LVAAWTGPEIPVREVELLDAERAALLLVIVDELVLLQSGHGVVWLWKVRGQSRRVALDVMIRGVRWELGGIHRGSGRKPLKHK